MGTISFRRQIPVEETDVLVIGGGPAGLASAIASARRGAKTTLVENSGSLGGMATIGLVGPFMTCYSLDGKDQIVKGIFDEVVRRMVEKGGAIHPSHIPAASPYSSFILRGHDHVTPFEPDVLKMVAFEMCKEAGVKLKLYTRFLDTTTSFNEKIQIKEAVVANKSGIQALRAKRFIDCTGDGDVAASCGVPMEKGRPEDKKMQPCTLFFRIGNVDSSKLISFVRENYTLTDRRFEQLLNKAREEMGYSIPQSGVGLYQTIKWDVWEVNHTRIQDIDGTNNDDLTRAHIEGQRQVFEALELLRKYIPGCENVELIAVAEQIGLRETRRIQGEYVLTVDDVINCTPFDDCVVACGFFVDIHPPVGLGRNRKPYDFPKGHHYEIPYRCLLPLKVENLLVAGRCVSATHEALGAIREMPFCFGMGEAAGAAAALSLKGEVLPSKLDYKLLQENMVENGAYIPSMSESASL